MPRKQTPADNTAHAFHQIEIDKVKEQLSASNEKYKTTLAALRDSESRLAAVIGMQKGIADSPRKHIKIKAEGRPGEATAVLQASDWHIEERVDPGTVNDLNDFNLVIAEQRVQNFFQRGLNMVSMCRARSRIDRLVLLAQGDFITGGIHEELRETSLLTPIEAVLKVYKLLVCGIEFLLDEGKFKQITVVCNHGNHARTTPKPRVATYAKTSYEWLLYKFLAEHFATVEQVEFQIADGYFNYLDIYGTKLRAHHGDWVKYQGGVGTVDIPLNKSIAQWNSPKENMVDIDILGHWHTRKMARNYCINGSLIGMTAYGLSIKAAYEPPSQNFFLIHPKYGKTVEIPIYLS